MGTGWPMPKTSKSHEVSHVYLMCRFVSLGLVRHSWTDSSLMPVVSKPENKKTSPFMSGDREREREIPSLSQQSIIFLLQVHNCIQLPENLPSPHTLMCVCVSAFLARLLPDIVTYSSAISAAENWQQALGCFGFT